MKKFEYYEPETVKEACMLLSKLEGQAKILAGGTDLIVQMKKGAITPGHVINIKKIKELDYIVEDKDGYRLGALTRLSDIVNHAGLQKRLPIISSSAKFIGSTQVRNLATLGGNLGNAAPSADMAPGLLVMEANVSIAGPSENRAMPLDKFFLGPGSVNIKKGEMLTEIFVPFPPKRTRQLYLKHGPRRVMDIAMAGVAVALSFAKSMDRCQKVRIALGAVAPVPVRAKKTEELIVEKKIDEISMDLVAETVSREANPISDVRASAGYRTEMVSTLTVRAINKLLTGVENG